jgi:hypothetical protein
LTGWLLLLMFMFFTLFLFVFVVSPTLPLIDPAQLLFSFFIFEIYGYSIKSKH